MNARLAQSLAALLLFAAVAAGAFGAHAAKAQLAPDLLATYQTAVQYHFWHALGLFGVGILLREGTGGALLRVAAWLLVAGIVLFSGSLYALALTGVRSLGAVTPVGGVAFLAAWALVAFAVWRR
jgi:uncharacterized membrane protein YgdD (TMEM256/DUF423 family)